MFCIIDALFLKYSENLKFTNIPLRFFFSCDFQLAFLITVLLDFTFCIVTDYIQHFHADTMSPNEDNAKR